MRYLSISVALFITATSVAIAQESNLQGVPKSAIREWPASASAPVAAAQPGSMIESEGSGAIPAMPLSVVSSGDITYITGGISDEEEAQLKSSAHDYNIRIMMTAPGGEYISDVTLRLTDNTGAEVLSIPSAGPYFYAHVKPGAYTIDMTAPGGGNKKLTVKVPENGAVRQHVAFVEQGGITTSHVPAAKID